MRTVWELACDSQPRADGTHNISEARGNRIRYSKVRANPLLKEGGLTDAAKLIWVISHVYDAGMTLYTLRNRFMTF